MASVSSAALVIEGCAVATVDATESELASGHVVVVGDRISAVGRGRAPAIAGARRVDGSGCLATPGLVNAHGHTSAWLTRGQAQQASLERWLAALYPVWAGLDAGLQHVAASAAFGALALSGCTTSVDHPYLVPREGGDVFAAVIGAARRVGLRLHLARGSVDIGASAGGLAPDSVVEDRDAILASCAELVSYFHDPGFSSMVRIALAPTAPTGVSRELMRESAQIARELGVRLHTHAAETVDEDDVCRANSGHGVVDYLDEVGWLGADVWLAHGIHLTDADIAKLAATGTGVAHCPSSNARLGAGIARIPELLAAQVPVGLGSDGAAANETGNLAGELRQALLLARARSGAGALTARQALRLATTGGARCLGRQDEIGSLTAGKLADLALWRLDGLGHAGIADPVAALVFGPRAAVQLLLVGGKVVVDSDELRTADTDTLAREAGAASSELARRAGR